MKKIITILLIALSFLVLTSCKKDGGKKPIVDGEYDMGGATINIICNYANRYDPRSEDYARLFRDKKLEALERVEKKFNVKIDFQTYPGNANWGAARDNWIVEQSKLQESQAHIFEVNTNAITNLAVQKAISPLDEYIDKYGSKGFWKEKRAFNSVLGKCYGYDDNYPYSDMGIYYNSKVLEEALGEERKLEPTKLWLEGKWTWEAFEKLAKELNTKLDSNRSEADGGPQYVIGGLTYDWAMPMVGSNGGLLVNDRYEPKFNTPEVIETMDFLSSLYRTEGMWTDKAPKHLSVEPGFVSGNVAFHSGQSWYLTDTTRMGNIDFDIEYVPFPVGPRAQDDMSKYFLNDVKGNATFVFNSAFAKENIPEGYDKLAISDEVLFIIWNELLYFPELNSDGSYDLETIKDDFYSKRLLNKYHSEESREAHLSAFDKIKPDFFYSILEAQGNTEGSYKIKLEEAIHSGDVRSVLEAIQPELVTLYNEKVLDRLNE